MEANAQLLRNRWFALAASLVVAAALVLPGRAGAAVYNYGTVSSDVFYGVFHTGSFLDQIQFTVATPVTVTLRDNYTDFSLVSGLAANLYNTPVVASPLYSSVGSTFVNLTPYALAAGSYELRITGTGLAGGYYSGYMTLSSTTMPIPEPETYAMLLAGLGLMGFVARRRKLKEGA